MLGGQTAKRAGRADGARSLMRNQAQFDQSCVDPGDSLFGRARDDADRQLVQIQLPRMSQKQPAPELVSAQIRQALLHWPKTMTPAHVGGMEPPVPSYISVQASAPFMHAHLIAGEPFVAALPLLPWQSKTHVCPDVQARPLRQLP